MMLRYVKQYLYQQMDQKAIEAEVKNYKMREGPLYKRSKFLKEWRERWIVLTMNFMFTFTSKNMQEVTDIIDLKNIKSYKSYLRKDEEMIPVGFKIRTTDDEYYFCAKSPNQKWSWIVSLERLHDYKYVGASSYNNADWIKSKGFESQLQFESGGKLDPIKAFDPTKAEKQQLKKDVDGEADKIMKELQKQQEQFKKKEEQLKQKEAMFILQQQKIKKEMEAKPVQKPVEKPVEKQVEKSDPNNNVARLKNLYEQKMEESSKQTVPNYNINIEKNSKVIKKHDTLHLSRAKVVTGLFDELNPQHEVTAGFQLFIDFLVKVGSKRQLGYNSFVVYESKTHENRKNFAQIFIQLLIDWKDYKNCLPLVTFIEICVFQSPGLFNQNQNRTIKKKLQQFLFNVSEQEKLQFILKDMFIMNTIQKYQKSNELNQKVQQLVKECKKEETRNWARKLKDSL